MVTMNATQVRKECIENAPTLNAAKDALASAIMEYANDFYNDYQVWSNAPNRKGHIPYIYKALLTVDVKTLGEEIECHAGKN